MITVNERVGNRNPKAETLCSTVYQVRVAGRICIAKIPKNKQVRELELNAFRAIQARSKQTESIRSTKKGSHPHIVRFIDEVRFLDGEGFLLERLKGPSLMTVLEMEKRDCRLSSNKRLEIVYQVTKAIEEMHNVGILNRDIKTDNVMFDCPDEPRTGKSNQRAVVFDFGIATKKDPQTQEEREQLKLVCGTPEVFAPEMFEIDRYSVAQEIYTIGALMYEVFSNREFRNLRGAQFSEFPQRIKEEIPRPSNVAQVDRDIEDIIMMAIARDPAKRFRSATQMREVIFDALIRKTNGEIEV